MPSKSATLLLIIGLLPALAATEEAAAPDEAATAEPADAISPAGACREAVLGRNAGAERVCSDAIARLAYDAGADPAANRALAGAHNNRALARIAAKDLTGAAEDIDEALRLTPESWAAYLNRGTLRLAGNEPEAALADYAKAQAMAPAATRHVLRNSVLAYRALGDPAQAASALAALERESR